MAKLSDTDINSAFAAYLTPGETLKYTAVGVKQPNMVLMLPLFVLAVLPGVIITALLTRNYLVGLTDQQLIVLRVKNLGNATVKDTMIFPLAEFSQNDVKTSVGAIFTHISIKQGEQHFAAKFHRAYSKSNRENSQAIAKAVSTA